RLDDSPLTSAASSSLALTTPLTITSTIDSVRISTYCIYLYTPLAVRALLAVRLPVAVPTLLPRARLSAASVRTLLLRQPAVRYRVKAALTKPGRAGIRYGGTLLYRGFVYADWNSRRLLMAGPLAIPVRDAVLRQLFAQPALIGWQDLRTDTYQHLGRLSDADDRSRGQLTLCVEQDAEKLLIHFHLPVKTRPSLLKNARHLHLVVPVENLRLSVDRLSVHGTRAHTKLQLEKIGVRPDTLLVYASLEIGTPAYVLMPIGSRRPRMRLSGTSGQLLRQLKSLTKAGAIDVYLEYGPVLPQLEGISSRLERGDLVTPLVDVDAMYERGLRCGKNEWTHYPCDEHGLSTASWNPLVDDDPPPYEEVAVNGQRNTVQELTSAKSPLALKEVSPHPSEVSSGATRIGWRSVQEPSVEPVQFTDAVPQRRTSPPNGLKRKAGHVFPDAEVVQSRNKAPHMTTASGGTREESPAPRDIVPHSQSARAADTSAQSLTQRGSTTEEDPSPVERMLLEYDAIRFSNTVTDFLRARCSRHDPSELDPFCLRSPHLFLELKEWIYVAWNYDTSACETYRMQLLTLGAAVRENDRSLFDATMRECQQLLLSRAPGRMLADATPVNQVSSMLDWLNSRICRNAGKLMMPLLVDLKLAAEKVETLELSQVADMIKARKEWNDKLAGAYAAVFRAFGGLV
ncbi:hypothetical protein SLS56_010546, partial [Neofusicoccum ribis]